jgi:hypothetical protein
MTNLQRRIERLERPAGASTQAGLRLIVMDAGATFAMDVDRCVEVLAESGFVPPGCCVLDFSYIPQGLKQDELVTYLREHGAEICSPSGRSAPTVGRS